MPTVNLIVIVALLVVTGIAVLVWRNSGTIASILMVAGIAVAAALVTMVQVDQYRAQQAAAQAQAGDAAQAQTANNVPPPIPPVQSAPVMPGLTGGAAPPVARSPYARS